MKLTEIGFIEKVPDQEYAYRVKEMMSIPKIRKKFSVISNLEKPQ